MDTDTFGSDLPAKNPKKQKLLIISIASVVIIAAITVFILSLVHPESTSVANTTVATDPHFTVSECSAELITDAGAEDGHAISYYDYPESGHDSKIIEVPDGKNILMASCKVTNLSLVPTDFLVTATGEFQISGQTISTTIYSTTRAYRDSNNYLARSTYGMNIEKGDSMTLSWVAFIDNTIATSGADITLNYSIRDASFTLNINDILTTY